MKRAYQYAEARNYTEQILDRRQRTTSFYLTINTGIVAAIGLILSASTPLDGLVLCITILILLLAGFIATWIWRSLLQQYETLLGWWYDRVRELEESLPEGDRLITREYNDLYGGGDPKKAKLGMTARETRLTEFIMALYVLFILAILLTLSLAGCKFFFNFLFDMSNKL